MRKLIAATGVVMTAASAQAATVDLIYTVEAVVTEYDYRSEFGVPDFEAEFPYPGPVIGDSETFSFLATIDTEDASYQELPNQPYSSHAEGFSSADGSANIFIQRFADAYTDYDLLPGGSGTIVDLRYFIPAVTYGYLYFDITGWTVEGLPVAPVPLPASLPLLVVGMAGLYTFKRRQASLPS